MHLNGAERENVRGISRTSWKRPLVSRGLKVFFLTRSKTRIACFGGIAVFCVVVVRFGLAER